MILSSFYNSKNFMLRTRISVYIRRDILTVHLKMTEVWPKSRVYRSFSLSKLLSVAIKMKEFAEKEAWKIHASSEQL